jgi:flagellar biosynthesis/type III secretory pathway M-ring protein FliF/YscJ
MASNTQTAVTKRESKAGTAIDRSKAFWQGLVPKQRMYLGVGIAITLATLTVLGNLMLTTDYKPLMTGLEAADAQTISAQLLAKKIPYVLSPDGTMIRFIVAGLVSRYLTRSRGGRPNLMRK